MSPDNEPQSPITHSKLLVVEGKDAFRFFKFLLQDLELLSEIEIRNFGGVSELADYLETLMGTSGWHLVTSLGIVRDAEANATPAFQSVRSALRKVNLSEPEHPMTVAAGQPRVSVFILPDCIHPGMLETLCLQAVGDDPAMPCIDQYFQCLQNQAIALPENMPKARLQAFLASRSRPGLKLGEAADTGYWPWANPTFDPLKQFLRAL
jgi:hypothetical protein